MLFYNKQIQQQIMSQIKEVNTLGTIASIRKATQDSLKPIIQEIQRKMVVINRETMQLTAKTQKISELEKRQNRSEESIRYLQSQVLDLKEHCQSIQLQQAADKEQRERSEEGAREDFRKIFKEKEKQDIIIQTMKERNERINKELNAALESMKTREVALEGRFKNLTERSEILSFQVKTGAEKMSIEFEQIKHTLNHEVKANMRRLSLLDMYEAEKDIISKKLQEMAIALSELVRQDQYDFYKQCVTKQQERVVNIVKKMIEDNLSQKTRDLLMLLPQMRQQILYCLLYEQKIQDVNKKNAELYGLISADRLEVDMNQNKFKTNVFDKFLTIEEERVEMVKGINKALGFQNQMIEKLDQYSDRLKDELREENYRKSRELFNEIKVSFADKKEEIRERQLQNIIQQRQKLFNRAQQMQNLANKIGQILTNFSTRITKVKSDNEIFVDKVKKQLLSIDILRKTINNNSSLIGEILSQMMETILITSCIQIEKESKNDEEIAFSTHYDGVIYQKYNHKQGENGNLLYRRKIMNHKLLKRALVASMTHIYDKLMDEDSCLCWNQHSPSLYFKDQIEPIYQNIAQKLDIEENDKVFKTRRIKDTDSFMIQPAKDTILSTFENNESGQRKYTTTHRSRKTRYDDNSIFLAKSARRVRGSINTTLALE